MPGQQGKGDGKNVAGRSNITPPAEQPNIEDYIAWKGEDKVIGEKSGT